MTNTGLTARAVFAALILTLGLAAPFAAAASASGPLRVHPTNPRYFADAQGRAVYLTGSHTWSNLQDIWTTSYFTFDFNAYLDMLVNNNHNFIRLWRIENPSARYHEDDPLEHSSPHPWKRSGPGTAGDGGLRFNFNQFDQAYFDRLRQRCIAAGNRGIYVGVMLFEGHGLTNTVDAWFSHPMRSGNNTTGINGDPGNNGQGAETHTLDVAAVTAIQEAYVRKVIDTLNDLDNIIYEIANESHPGSIAWQQHMIDYIQSYQASKPQQHLVWFSTTFPSNTGNSELWNTNAQVISPGTAANNAAYRDNPPVNNGSKIIITDTDHLWGCGGTGSWVWKSFTRGLHPIYMEGYYSNASFCPPNLDMRKQMGHTRSFAIRMSLANAIPSTTLSNSTWCLAETGKNYLVYAPNGGNVTLNLSGVSGTFNVEWFNPSNAQTTYSSSVNGGGLRSFVTPFGGGTGHAVLFVSMAGGAIGIGDLDADGVVDVADLLIVLTQWGECPACAGDANSDGQVNVQDLLIVLTNWT